MVEVDLKRTSQVGLKATGLMDSKHQVRGVRPLPLPLPACTGHTVRWDCESHRLDERRGGVRGSCRGLPSGSELHAAPSVPSPV